MVVFGVLVENFDLFELGGRSTGVFHLADQVDPVAEADLEHAQTASAASGLAWSQIQGTPRGVADVVEMLGPLKHLMRMRFAGEVNALGSFVALDAGELVQTDSDAKLSKLRRAVNNF